MSVLKYKLSGKERARNKFRIFRFLDAHLARRRNAVIVGLCQVFATRTNEMDRKLKTGSYFVLVPKRYIQNQEQVDGKGSDEEGDF